MKKANPARRLGRLTGASPALPDTRVLQLSSPAGIRVAVISLALSWGSWLPVALFPASFWGEAEAWSWRNWLLRAFVAIPTLCLSTYLLSIALFPAPLCGGAEAWGRGSRLFWPSFWPYRFLWESWLLMASPALPNAKVLQFSNPAGNTAGQCLLFVELSLKLRELTPLGFPHNATSAS